MEHRKYLIIGGGLAADAAIRGIREVDHAGSILAVSDEDDPPYNRPPLSKALWKGSAVDTIWRRTELTGAELRLGTRIVALDRAAKTAIDAAGATFAYDRLLLATGGRHGAFKTLIRRSSIFASLPISSAPGIPRAAEPSSR